MVQHLYIVLDHMLREHAVAEVFDLIFNALHCVFIIPKNIHLLGVTKQESGVVPASCFLQEVGEQVEQAASLWLQKHLRRPILVARRFQQLLSVQELFDATCRGII